MLVIKEVATYLSAYFDAKSHLLFLLRISLSISSFPPHLAVSRFALSTMFNPIQFSHVRIARVTSVNTARVLFTFLCLYCLRQHASCVLVFPFTSPLFDAVCKYGVSSFGVIKIHPICILIKNVLHWSLRHPHSPSCMCISH